ncbi:hypothetical protein ACTXT7_009045 [Hymenolepis weldensis]
MDSQVEFLQYEFVSNDAFSKSDITAAVFDENLRLRQDKERLLEQFRQQIHEIEREKETVRLRLIAVENDYDTQMKELQMEIMTLREEVQQQKRRCVRTNLEYEKTLQSLTEENVALNNELESANNVAAGSTAHVKEMQQHLRNAHVAIQGHVQQIENLRAEIDRLKEDKLTLEQKLLAITEERDSLLTALSDTQQANALLHRENASQELLLLTVDAEMFLIFSNHVGKRIFVTTTLLDNQTINQFHNPRLHAKQLPFLDEIKEATIEMQVCCILTFGPE